MKIRYSFIFYFFLLLSCSSPKRQEIVFNGEITSSEEVDYPLTIDLEACMRNQSLSIKLSSFVEDVFYIPIKNQSEDIYIRYLSGLEYDEQSCLFILNDPFYAITVDTLGHFVNQIGRIGQGPGEYKQIANISVNSEDKLIYIKTAYKHNAITYDYNGHVIRESSPMGIDLFTGTVFYYDHALWGIGIPYTSRALRVRKEKRLFYGYVLLDSLCRRTSLQTANPIEPYGDLEGLESGISQPGISIYKDVVLLTHSGGAPSDTVYTIRNKQFVPRYFLNYGSHRPDISKIWSQGGGSSFDHSYVSMNQAFETERFFFIEIRFQGKCYIICYDKYIGKGFSIPMTICLNERGTPLAQGFENDIDGGLPFYPQSVSSSGTYWLAYMNPSDMKEILTEEYFAAHPDIQNKKKQDKLRAIVANADEEDNPILVLLKLRK